MSRAILTPALVLGFLAAAPLVQAVEGEKATYLGGSVVSIPRYKEMILDFADGQNLKFHYDKGSFAIGYAQITAMEMGRSGWRGTRVKKIPVWFKKDSPAITVRFKGEDGVDQVMVLAMSSRDTMSAVPVLEARTGKQVVNAGSASESAESGWWGDRYWKTQRNSQVWAKRAAQADAANSDAEPSTAPPAR